MLTRSFSEKLAGWQRPFSAEKVRVFRLFVEVRSVVNRFGQPQEVPFTKAEEALGLKIAHYVPDDPKTVNRANNNGVPVVLENASCKVSRSLVQLATILNGKQQPS